MKKLYLTSLNLDGLIDFAGGLKDKRVAFISTAAEMYEDKGFVERDHVWIKDQGAELVEFTLTGMSRGKLEKKLEDIDVVYVSGGNTFYLLEKNKS